MPSERFCDCEKSVVLVVCLSDRRAAPVAQNALQGRGVTNATISVSGCCTDAPARAAFSENQYSSGWRKARALAAFRWIGRMSPVDTNGNGATVH